MYKQCPTFPKKEIFSHGPLFTLFCVYLNNQTRYRNGCWIFGISKQCSITSKKGNISHDHVISSILSLCPSLLFSSLSYISYCIINTLILHAQ
ncbi:hypothetical protein BDZ94DRAFT_1271621, partial [Collybia nuda]